MVKTFYKYNEWYSAGNISSKFKSLSLEQVLCIDIETTGLDTTCDEILQLSICDGNGKEVLNKLYKPRRKRSWIEAQKIHGINPDMVKKEHPFGLNEAHLISALVSKADLIIGYNFANFDKKFLNAAGVVIRKPIFDVMLEFAPVQGRWDNFYNHWKWYRLNQCAKYYDYEWQGNAHDALADVRATAYCFRKMITEGSDYCAVSDFLAKKNFDAVLKDWDGVSRANYLEYPQCDEIDEDIIFCYIRELPDGLLSQRAEKALNAAIEAKNGRRYKTKAKGAKWTVITDPEQDGVLCSNTFERDHNKEKKVCYLPDLLDYLGVDRKGFDTRWEAGRKRCAKDINKWFPCPSQLKQIQNAETSGANIIPTLEKEEVKQEQSNQTIVGNIEHGTASVGRGSKPIDANQKAVKSSAAHSQRQAVRNKDLQLVAFIFSIMATIIGAFLILPLFWRVPMSVYVWKVYKGEKRNSFSFAVCELLFCSIVAGLLLLISEKQSNLP